jgi:hypothetical protein
MRFEGSGGSRVDIETIGTGGVIVSVTQARGMEAPDVAIVVLDVNHAEALALGITAAVRELAARAKAVAP